MPVAIGDRDQVCWRCQCGSIRVTVRVSVRVRIRVRVSVRVRLRCEVTKSNS